MEKTNNNPIFRLTGFEPIAFKKISYPVQHCSLCRGYLTDICGQCLENNSEKCDVINKEGNYYHQHCFTQARENKK